MATGGKSIEEILKALQGTGVLQGQQPSSTTPIQAGAAAYPPPNAQQQYSMPPGMPPYQQATPSYPPSTYPGASYPPPPAYPPAAGAAAGGGIDLSAIKPVSSGTVSIEAAIERAKAIAAEKGVAPYDRSTHPQYASDHRSGHNVDPRGGYGRSRSRSPPARRDPYRDNFSAYRDERREASREYGRGARERSYSPAPRGGRTSGTFSPRGGHNANARERSPLRGDDNSEIIEIESSLVGLIIGRQGENLRRVESETGCRVQFLTPPGDTTPYRQCKITGPRARRAEARTSINRIIEDSGMGAIARAGLEKGGGGRDSRDSASGSGPPSLRENEDSMQIMVPDRTVGLIIGRGGETIRDLQERSGCHINIVGESKSVNGLRPVNLIGPSDSTMKAKNLILEIVDSDTRNANSGRDSRNPKQQQHDIPRDMGGHEKVNDSIYVPSEAVGMIIGKGGETIREMQNMTGCKINVSQSSGPGEVEREIGLVGNRDAISKAKRAIEDKVETVMQRIKNGPPGGGGGRGRGHQRHDDYDKPQNNYGRPDRNENSGAGQQQQQQQPPAQQAVAPGAADPYAPYGGYQNYLALWYQAIAGAANQAPADGSKPAGT